MQSKYVLEVYEPKSNETVAFSFNSDQPFGSFSVGDLLWNDVLYQSQRLKIEAIEHLVWEIKGSHITHKICIFTSQANPFSF